MSDVEEEVVDESTDTTETDDTVDDLEGLDEKTRARIERANAQAARFRREARAATDELASFKKQSETETEKQLREAEERGFARAIPMLVDSEMAIAAAGKLRDPGVASSLVDQATREELAGMSDPADRRARCKELVDDLLEKYPYMAVGQDGNGKTDKLVTQGGRSRAPAGSAQSPDAWLRDEARRR